MAQLMAPEAATPVEAYIEALDDAVCEMIEGVEDEAQEVVERVEANLEVASEAVTDVDATLAEPVAEAIAEPRLDTVAQEQGTEAAAEPLAYAADIDTPVGELVTLEPTPAAAALAEALGETKPKASKKKPKA